MIRTFLHSIPFDKLERFLAEYKLGEIISLGIRGEHFVVVTTAVGQSLRAAEKQMRVEPPHDIGTASLLIEGIMVCNGTCVVSYAGTLESDSSLFPRLIEVAIRRYVKPRRQHIVLQTWRPPATTHLVRRSGRNVFTALQWRGGEGIRFPRLTPTNQVAVVLGMRDEVLCCASAQSASRTMELHAFESPVLEISRIVHRGTRAFEFVVSTERSFQRFVFEPESRRLTPLSESEATTFLYVAELRGPFCRLVAVRTRTGDLMVGPPDDRMVGRNAIGGIDLEV